MTTANNAQSAERQRQMAEAEEVLGDRLANVGFAKGLYFGKFLQSQLLPYPLEASPRSSRASPSCSEFCRDQVDPVAIDRQAEIPESVVRGLGKLGVLGACLPDEFGGRGHQPDRILPTDRSLGRPLRQHGAIRQCPPFDWPASAGALRHARATSSLVAEAGERRMDQRLRPHRA